MSIIGRRKETPYHREGDRFRELELGTVITLPAGTGPVSPQRESFTMREFGKMKA
jgi:hypothetical protein